MPTRTFRKRIAVSFILLSWVSVVAFAQPFTVKTGLFDQNKPEDMGLSVAPGTETVTIFAPSANTTHYCNQVMLAPFKGMLYAMWQTSATDEDATDTKAVFSRSVDGKTWPAYTNLAVPFNGNYCTSGGWWVTKDSLIAYINVWDASVTPRQASTYYTATSDGQVWTKLKPVLMSDGTQMKAQFEQDPHRLPDGRIICAGSFQPGLQICPLYSDDQSGTKGWKKGTYTPISSTNVATREMEPSWFWQRDGKAVMIFRDQGSTYRSLASVSTNRGQSWTTAVVTDMLDSRSKQSAGNLPDGTAFIVNNPAGIGSRIPLAISLSTDSKTFDRAFVMRKGGSDLQAQRYTGKAKTLGYSYPKTIVWQGYLYVGYAVNKEDVQCTRIPLSSLGMTSDCVYGKKDKCDRCVSDSTGKTACTSSGEAETDACSYDGTVDQNNAGFKGTGFINVPNAIGSKITFGVNATASGTKILSFRYANGSTVNRSGDLYVNGTKMGSIAFLPTGAFTTYVSVDVNLALLSGNNKVELVSSTADGLANIDQIGYVSTGLSNGGCVITGLDEIESNQIVSIYPNPSKTNFHVNTSKTMHMQIIDSGGKILEEHNNVSSIEFGERLKSGIYFLKIDNKVYKVIKE